MGDLAEAENDGGSGLLQMGFYFRHQEFLAIVQLYRTGFVFNGQAFDRIGNAYFLFQLKMLQNLEEQIT